MGGAERYKFLHNPVVERVFLHAYVSKRPKFFTLKIEGQAKWGLLTVLGYKFSGLKGTTYFSF